MKSDNISLLLSINETIATFETPQDVMGTIFSKISKIYDTPVAGMCLFDKEKKYVDVFIGEKSMLKSLRKVMDLSALPKHGRYDINEQPFGLKLSEKKSAYQSAHKVLELIGREEKSEFIREIIVRNHIRDFLRVPMRCGGNAIGYMIFGLADRNPFDQEKLEFMLQVANLAAVALNNIKNYDELKKRETFQAILLKITNSLVSVRDSDGIFDKLTEITGSIEYGPEICHYVELKMTNFFEGDPVIVRIKKSKKFEYIPCNSAGDIFSILEKNDIKPANDKDSGYVFHQDLESLCSGNSELAGTCRQYGIHQLYWQKYTTQDGSSIEMMMGLRHTIIQPDLELSIASHMIPQFAVLLKNFVAYEKIDMLKKQLEQEKVSLIDEISHSDSYQEIIGSTPIIQSVLYKVRQVASLEATVLILGETGTGKELIARAIHNTSDRKNQAMVRVNCATLPAQLIESELFGHEKGSFTGAIEKRIGKFELANGGTIFLDEIGEMPLDLQSKLLRVLQEKEFERIGGRQTIKSDVRVIAATNRNLETEVEAGKFRADLFYRLNVFPITVPPLNKRKEDIPLFVQHFIEKFAKSMGKPVKEISKSDLESLMSYEWPGNVRELEHLIEKATIISGGPILDISDFIFSKNIRKQVDISQFKPLIEIEKEYIISALKAANGKVMGENSASALLGLNGKTLGSKMRKLGIKREITINY